MWRAPGTCCAAVEAALPADIGIFAAAVADWRVADAGAQKMKKNPAGLPALTLVENPDILATIAHREAGRPALVVGFAAETENVVAHASASSPGRLATSSSPTMSRPEAA